MYAKSLVAAVAVVGLSALQSCPAPGIGAAVAVGIGLGIGAPLAGNLIYIGLNDNLKREPSGVKMSADPRVAARADYPAGVPASAHNAYDVCQAQNGDGRTTTVRRLSENSFQITGVAPACMTLSNYFTEGALPYPCGNDCLQYDNLSNEGVAEFMETLRQLGVA